MQIFKNEWAKGNASGRNEADALILRIQREGCPLDLLRRFDPEANACAVDVGFFNRIAERLLLQR